MQREVFASSATCEWETPQDFFDRLNAEYQFELDVCATAENAKCERYFTKEQDALKQEWNGTCWMNPPYGREIGNWMRKAYESMLGGATVVCLVPARTDTAWCHDYAMKGEITFIRGRLKFGGQKCNAPFPSAVVVFKKSKEEHHGQESNCRGSGDVQARINTRRPPEGDSVHTFYNLPFGLVGADWSREDILEKLHKPGVLIELTGESARKMSHGMCVHPDTEQYYQSVILFVETDEEKINTFEEENT